MKKSKWPVILGALAAALVFVATVIVCYIVWFLPDIPLREIKPGISVANIEHGKYLANHVMVCIDCHSARDWTKFSGPVVAGTDGKGGEIFDEKMGFPGNFRSPNITPYHLKEWTDAEIYRAVTSGVSRDGHPLFPIMPYPAYATLNTGDIFDVIAYIRTLQSVTFTPPRSDPAFPMNIVLHLFPCKPSPSVKPPESDTVRYGEYLVRAAGCVECHTPARHGQIDKALSFTGGREFGLTGGMLCSANITPDPETGIGSWTQEMFVARFRGYDPAVYAPAVLKRGDQQSIMPWTMYAGMTTADLAAIYHYLHSLKPVKNKVLKIRPLVAK
ncbi:MAG: c-type cytochrome [Bacteroidota bacterium]